MKVASGIRLLLIGSPNRSEFRTAAGIARATGAEVKFADTPAHAFEILRSDHAEVIMIDVELDVTGFMGQLRRERFAVPVLACGIHASADRAVAAIRAGACDYVPLPPDPELIAAALTAVAPHQAVSIVGEDPVLRRAVAFAKSVANSRSPVLIEGETGTGKETMARAIHLHSGRAGRFVSVECAGVGPDIVEAELFGHDTRTPEGIGARRLGRLEEAIGGTLFIANIDCLSPMAQARLLTVLENASPKPSGLATDVRLVASTHRDLETLVREGSFRADLLVRLNLLKVALPALRERGDDIPLLASHLAERLAETHGLERRSFAEDTLVLLREHDWPLNVRELESVVHRALLLATEPAIDPLAIVLNDGGRIGQRVGTQDEKPVRPTRRTEVEALVGRTVEEVERDLILQTLEHCHGNRTSASTILGISVRTMRNKLKTFIEAGIPVAPAF